MPRQFTAQSKQNSRLHFSWVTAAVLTLRHVHRSALPVISSLFGQVVPLASVTIFCVFITHAFLQAKDHNVLL
jgi:hypothetical protein